MAARMCDLPQELVKEKILARIPITSLRAVRSTCKSCEALTKSFILGKAVTATQQFLGFMTMNSKVFSVSFNLKKDSVDPLIKPVELLDGVEIWKVFHCDGLLLCVAKDQSRLVVWNPYLCQTRWIRPRTKFHAQDFYALGYDMNRNHKILRFVDNYYSREPERVVGYEIYELGSNSWRVLNVTPEWEIHYFRGGVPVKGNTYFFAQEKLENIEPEDECGTITEIEDFLLCFDFTRERFGPRLPLPFHSYSDDCVTFSCVRDEQLAVLYYRWNDLDSFDDLEIWVTTRIAPNSVSWSKFLKVETRLDSLICVRFHEYQGGSFFVDEQEKVAVVFDLDEYLPTKTARYHTAFIFGEEGLLTSERLGEAHNLGERCPKTGFAPERYRPAFVCSSSYRPSLVQVHQPRRKRKERDMSR